MVMYKFKQRIDNKAQYIHFASLNQDYLQLFFDSRNNIIEQQMEQKQASSYLNDKLISFCQKFHASVQNMLKNSFQAWQENLICQKFMLIRKIFEMSNIAVSQILPQIKQCLLAIFSFLQSSEYQKYGHTYNLYAHTLKRFQELLSNEQPYNHHRPLQMIQTNKRLQSLRGDAISTLQIKCWNTPKINCFFYQVTQGRVLLQNPECVCCSQVFVRGSSVKNLNYRIGTVKSYHSGRTLEKFILQKHVNAICNEGGGVLIIGSQIQRSNIIIKGIQFKNKSQIQKMENQIQAVFRSIQPPSFECVIERVLVHTNFFEQDEMAIQQKMRICFRIKLFAHKFNRVTYLKNMMNSNHFTYESYKYNQNNQPTKITYNEGKKQKSIYQLIHWKYQRKEESKCSHENIDCLYPYNIYSLKLVQLISRDPEMFENANIPDSEQQNFADISSLSFKFKHASLLVVSTIENFRHIESFLEFLKSMKIPYELSQPFKKYFPTNMRSIFLISHQINHAPFRKMLKQLQNNSQIPKHVITMIPIFNNLQIEANKLDTENLEYFKKKFKRLSKDPYQIQQGLYRGEGKQKKMTCFHFENKSNAILGYMMLQELGLRPYTFKQNISKETNMHQQLANS